MARPIKNNADYFSHDADMRDDPKIKAVRRKFGLEGYAVWCMLLEVITDSENFTAHCDSISNELLAGDFGLDVLRLEEMLRYFNQLDLIQFNGVEIKCKTLENRFSGLLSKRKRDRGEVIADDNTQSKVKESKVKKSTVEKSKVVIGAGEPATLEQRAKDFMERIAIHLNEYPKEMLREFYEYWIEKNDGGRKMRFEMQKVFDVKRRLTTWSKNENKNGHRKGITAQGTADRLNSYTNQ